MFISICELNGIAASIAMAVRRRPRAASGTTLMQNGAKAFADFLLRALVIGLFRRIWSDLSGYEAFAHR